MTTPTNRAKPTATMKFPKPKVGQTVFIVGRSRGDRTYTTEVLKVGPKYFTVELWHRLERFHLDTWGHDGKGFYDAYPSADEYAANRNLSGLRARVQRALRLAPNPAASLTQAQLEEVLAVLRKYKLTGEEAQRA